MIINVTKAQLSALFQGERVLYTQTTGTVNRVLFVGSEMVYELQDALTVVQMQAFIGHTGYEVTKLRADVSEA